MTTVCLLVATITGAYCYQGADRIGHCNNLEDVAVCRVEAEELPLYFSWYNPQLCYEGHTINCDGSPEHAALGLIEDWMYGEAAACPPGWTRWGRTAVIQTAWGDYTCIDRGGRIHPMWREVWTANGLIMTWAIVVDLLAHERPDNGYYLTYDWSLSSTDTWRYFNDR